MKRYDPIAEYCADWVRWCATRRLYIRPPTKSLLARLQPSKSGTEPNAPNHPDMQYFNMAIHTMADMAQWRREWPAFYAHYIGSAQVVKVTAGELGIGVRTYYDHVTRFSKAAFSLAASIKKVQEAMAPDGTRAAPAR
jgi:hypothetical protein